MLPTARLLWLGVLLSIIVARAYSSALAPVKAGTEQEFYKLKNHERTFSMDQFMHKWTDLHQKWNWSSYNPHTPQVSSALERLKTVTKDYQKAHHRLSPPERLPNVLLLVADDLGYGDLSVLPFVTPYSDQWPCDEGGILTPNLERMAKKGVIMSNFHAASPVCSPSRVSILTGLYPWRLGALGAFELGQDLTQRNGFLPQIPTIAEILRENGYYTFHSGKWHLGGMREEQRVDRVSRSDCSHPSPNQHGFQEYVSELDGPESPRYTFLLRNSILHSQGHRFLIRDDIPLPNDEPDSLEQHVLSDREVNDAIDFIEKHEKRWKNQPWFAQVWFNAPHGPWEHLAAGETVYSKEYGKDANYWRTLKCGPQSNVDLYSIQWYYKTMVTAMDVSIGKLLDALERLNLEKDTLVVFVSDNGPETSAGAGTGGRYSEGKRSLMEGGVRVPAIWQWPGKFPANSLTPDWGATTDLLPTFLDAIGIPRPPQLLLDGISLMPSLSKATPLLTSSSYRRSKSQRDSHEHQFLDEISDIQRKHFIKEKLTDRNSSMTMIIKPDVENRLFLWHKDTESYPNNDRFQSAAYFKHIKIITTSETGCLLKVFDMRWDPYEKHNLLRRNQCEINFVDQSASDLMMALEFDGLISFYCDKHHNKADCRAENETWLIKKILIMLSHLKKFVQHGNHAHQYYMNNDLNHARCGVPSYSQVAHLHYNTSCSSPNDCSWPLY